MLKELRIMLESSIKLKLCNNTESHGQFLLKYIQSYKSLNFEVKLTWISSVLLTSKPTINSFLFFDNKMAMFCTYINNNYFKKETT